MFLINCHLENAEGRLEDESNLIGCCFLHFWFWEVFFSKTTHFLTKCLISGCFIFLKSHHGWFWPGKFSIFVPPDALKMHSLTLPVLCKTFSKLPQFTLWNIMTINLWKLQSNLNWKDAASRLEKIVHSNVNYLHNLMNASWFLKKSRRKSKHLHDLLCI